MQFWMSRFIRSQGGRSAEWVNGFRFTRIWSVETTYLVWILQFRQCHAIFQGTIMWRLLAVGYHSRRLARCPRLTLVNPRRCRQWARRHCVWNIWHWQHCIFTDESRFKLHHTDGRARLCSLLGERHIGVCVQGTDDFVGPSFIVWAGFHYGGKRELVGLGGATNQQVYVCCNKVFYPGQEPPSTTTFSWTKIMPRPTLPEPLTLNFLENQGAVSIQKCSLTSIGIPC